MKVKPSFTDYEIYSLQIGEETGQLVFILNELKDYYTKKIAQRRKIVSALAYPVIVLIVAVLAITFMLRFLVPMFANVYKQFGGELPAITKTVLALSMWLKNYSLIILIVIVAGISLYYFFRKNKKLRRITDKIPPITLASRECAIHLARELCSGSKVKF